MFLLRETKGLPRRSDGTACAELAKTPLVRRQAVQNVLFSVVADCEFWALSRASVGALFRSRRNVDAAGADSKGVSCFSYCALTSNANQQRKSLINTNPAVSSKGCEKLLQRKRTDFKPQLVERQYVPGTPDMAPLFA